MLSAEYDVTALFFHRPSIGDTPDVVRRGLAAISDLADARAFPVPQDGGGIRFVADHALSLMSRRPYTRWMYDSKPARRVVRRLVAERDFDIAHLESLDLAAFLSDLPKVPLVCAHHNVESQLLRRLAEAAGGPVERSYIRHQAGLMEREERGFCGRFALNLVVSAEDRRTLSTIAPEARYLLVPNGVDTKEFVPAPAGPRDGLIFVGGHGWFPNRDGMEFFARSVLPLVRAARPDVQVTWVGKAAEEAKARFAQHGVDMTGYLPDIRPLVHRAACFIVPLRVGGGTRLKILDAWSLGKAVVSTSVGCEGLEVADGKNILVADEPEDFASAILRVLECDALRATLEEGGRATAVTVYDWDAIGEGMLAAYRDL
jgi:glycosyltransferase involved in cell wall biosynthesis